MKATTRQGRRPGASRRRGAGAVGLGVRIPGCNAGDRQCRPPLGARTTGKPVSTTAPCTKVHGARHRSIIPVLRSGVFEQRC